ncbi:hypothetical protein ACIA5A_02000 [Micromonospora sp. NPDC051300]|uniref:hypothetical protein n=1 Tax=Micromonospora sp. NPDC051300 TaxID=3364286 RepID=UPI0037A3EDCE
MRVRDRSTTVVVTLAFVLAALVGPPAAAPLAVQPSAAAPPETAADRVTAPGAPPETAADRVTAPGAPPETGADRVAAPPVPDSGCRSGSEPVVAVGAYPRRPCAELSRGWWGDRRGGLAYGDGPDEPLPAAPPSVAGPVVSARSAPAHRSPAPPLPPRGVRAARAPPTA